MTTDTALPELTKHQTALAALWRVLGVTASALAIGLVGVNSPTTTVWVGITTGLLLSVPAVLWVRRNPDPLDAWVVARLLPWSGIFTGGCLAMLLQALLAPPPFRLFFILFLLLSCVVFGVLAGWWLPSYQKSELWVRANLIGNTLALGGPLLLLWLLPGVDIAILLRSAAVCLVLLMGVMPALLMLRLGSTLPKKQSDLTEQIARIQSPNWLVVRVCVLVVAVLMAWSSWLLGSWPVPQ